MFHVEASPEREKLGFAPTVITSFKFLSNFNFHLVDQKSTFVRFESSALFLNVYHGRSSYEMDIELGRKTDPEKYLTIGSIVDWAGAYKAEGFGHHGMFQVSSYEGVRQFLPKLASLVEKYATPLLRKDKSAWKSALQLKSKRSHENSLNELHRRLRESADDAWRAHDYGRVVEIYTFLRDHLTVLEEKRLAYAEAHPPTFWTKIEKLFSRKTT